ncbi:acyl-CoA thioesterase [Acidisoma cladoniae]|jgi:acyl-CoA thioester hydrolase|uniref:acyl-CoA thioesterase n=1 Tax=Acidisoma cladoniae TaxID=3040935 RepID=UPI00254BE4D8|nr:thioesterase family protein [Acidisoma sp. PAMC 29798]
MSDTDLALRAAYRVWGQETVRYSDTDAMGHVNNVAYAAFLETGRTTLVRACGLPVGHSATSVVLARVEIDYLLEVYWPATLDIGIAVTGLGRSSITMVQGLFLGDLCVARGREVLVLMDTQTRRSTPLPDDVRATILRVAGMGEETS